MKDYRIEKTTMGHKIKVKLTPEEIREQKILRALIVVTPFAMCWLFAAAAGMV